MKRVITYGTFDLLHYGHINLLRRAKKYGDYLIVALSTDEFNNKKGKKSYLDYQKIKAFLEAIRYVDLVIPENNWEQKINDIHKYHINTFAMEDDWKGKFDFLKSEGVDVVYLSRTPEISSSKIKKSKIIQTISSFINITSIRLFSIKYTSTMDIFTFNHFVPITIIYT